MEALVHLEMSDLIAPTSATKKEPTDPDVDANDGSNVDPKDGSSASNATPSTSHGPAKKRIKADPDTKPNIGKYILF